MKLINQTSFFLFSIFIFCFLLCSGCESKVQKENREKERKEEILRIQKDSVESSRKLKVRLSKYPNYGRFTNISLELFEKDFDQYKGKIYLVNLTDLASSFRNHNFEREDFYSEFWSPMGIHNNKLYAMLEADPPTIFELDIPLKRLPKYEEELKNYNSFIFRIDKIDFFLDYYSETFPVYLSNSDGYDEIELEGENEYEKENMIYRRIEGELLELF